jgi:hypothetical protein
MTGYQCEALSRARIRQFALGLRKKLRLEETLYFNIIGFLEFVMPKFDDGFHFEIVPKDELPPEKHAYTDVINKTIYIREDVYKRAVQGEGRDRMTIAHEIGHYILIVVQGIKLYRTFNGAFINTSEDPEWQAKVFAGELLCPFNLISGMSVIEIMKGCGVSEAAANVHFIEKNRGW